jgi:hypothetical protein
MQYTAAADEALQAIRLNDRLAPAYYCLGVANMGMERQSQAQMAFEQCLQIDPSIVQARERLAQLHELAATSQGRAHEPMHEASKKQR